MAFRSRAPQSEAPGAVAVGAEEVDIRNLSHLHGHPEIAPLYAKRGEIRERQHALAAQLHEAQQALAQLQSLQGFSPMVDRRKIEDRISDLERQAGGLEAQLSQVQEDIETSEERVKVEMTPALAREGVGLVQEFLGLIERLDNAMQRYSAYDQRSYKLLDKHLAPLPWPLAYIPGCREPLGHVLTKLQRVSQE